MVASNARPAAALDKSACFAMCSISSVLFTRSLLELLAGSTGNGLAGRQGLCFGFKHGLHRVWLASQASDFVSLSAARKSAVESGEF
jgi:hypothetical protein